MTDLRELLQEASGDAPVTFDAASVLRGVDARRRRHRVRRAALVGALVPIVIIAVVLVLLRVGDTSTHPEPAAPEPAPGPTVPTAPLARTWTPAADRWTTLPASPIGNRTLASTVATDHEVIVWGGETVDVELDRHADGAAFDIATGTWRKLAPSPLRGRSEHAAVWTGDAMFVVGGAFGQSTEGSRSGGVYHPAEDRWEVLPPSPVDDVTFMTAVWTGREVIVLGGVRTEHTVVGGMRIKHEFMSQVVAAFDPALRRWRTLEAPPSPFEFGRSPAVAWDGSGLAVLASDSAPSSIAVPPSDIFSFWQASTEEWRRRPAPATARGSLIWTGTELLVFGSSNAKTSPALYEVVAASLAIDSTRWSPLPAIPLAPRTGGATGAADSQAAVWTGREMVVWTGGLFVSGNPEPYPPGPVLAFDPVARTWRTLPLPPANEWRPSMVVIDGTVIVDGRWTIQVE